MGRVSSVVVVLCSGCGYGALAADDLPVGEVAQVRSDYARGDGASRLALGDSERESIAAAVAESLGQGLATGYSVAIWRAGHIIYSEGFGVRDELGSPVTPDTLFQIGSDTKKVTAIALLRQVDAGVITLDDTVTELVPELQLAAAPEQLSKTTVHDLLAHQSGLYDYSSWVELPGDDGLREVTLGAFASNEVALMPPGLAYNYSNPAFSIAGLLNEAVERRPWADIVQSEVFEPLGMLHTYARRDDMLAAESDMAGAEGVNVWWIDPFDPDAANAQPINGWIPPEAEIDNAFTRPAGLVWSTASDQVRLMGFLLDGDPELLSDELRQAMMTPHAPLINHLETAGYGYGLFIQSVYAAPDGTGVYDVPLVFHGGNTQTMTSASTMLPEQRVAVSVLANGALEDLTLVTAAGLAAAAGGALPPPSPLPPGLDPPAADLGSYAGIFTDPSLSEVRLAFDGTQITVEAPLLDQLAIDYGSVLQPVALDLFRWSLQGTDYTISFYDGEDGTPHAYGVNRLFVWTRVSEAEPAAPCRAQWAASPSSKGRPASSETTPACANGAQPLMLDELIRAPRVSAEPIQAE
jgi:CubicO group peptidase (beta-lactamase class C family)